MKSITDSGLVITNKCQMQYPNESIKNTKFDIPKVDDYVWRWSHTKRISPTSVGIVKHVEDTGNPANLSCPTGDPNETIIKSTVERLKDGKEETWYEVKVLSNDQVKEIKNFFNLE